MGKILAPERPKVCVAEGNYVRPIAKIGSRGPNLSVSRAENPAPPQPPLAGRTGISPHRDRGGRARVPPAVPPAPARSRPTTRRGVAARGAGARPVRDARAGHSRPPRLRGRRRLRRLARE